MEFTVKRNAILSELNLVQGVIERKTTIPILSNILLSASGDRVDIKDSAHKINSPRQSNAAIPLTIIPVRKERDSIVKSIRCVPAGTTTPCSVTSAR